MAFFDWNDKQYSVSVSAMDHQHKNLVRIINAIYDASNQPPNQAATSELLDELIQYTVSHFAEEEKFMESIQYPALIEHKMQHQGLITRAGEVKKAFKAGDGTVELGVLNFLKTWLITHIQGHDMKYGEYSKAPDPSAKETGA